MRSLSRKLLRDLWALKAQALAIALVMGAGVTMLVTYHSTFHSLDRARAIYYERQQLADVFATLERAPSRLERRIAELPGVTRVSTRVVAEVTLDVEGLDEPAVGRLVSLPDRDGPDLNRVFLLRGNWVDPARPDDVLVNEAFAVAHALEPGDRLAAVINGRRRQLVVAGVALSPEYVYSLSSGSLLPDDRRFGVLWMGRRALATAFDLDGAFNDVALALAPGASQAEVIARLDRLLAPYGGLGAIPRSLQISNWFVENELKELSTFGTIAPAIFLSVAAFLLHIVFARILSVQRSQIAALKALGYSNLQLAQHFAAMAAAVGIAGAVIGIAAGARLGFGMTGIYRRYFRFPIIVFEIPPSVVAAAVLVCVAAAVLGAWTSVWRAVRVPPAEAMRPEPPISYRPGWIERLGLRPALSTPARMVLRHLTRRPLRTGLSVIGLSLAVAILVVGSFILDALDYLLRLEFEVARRHDATVTFVLPRSAPVLDEARRLPGVLRAEPFRTAPARLRFGHRSREMAITGLAAGGQLQRQVSSRGRAFGPPATGLSISSKLAELLGVEPGRSLTVEILEGERRIVEVPVSRIIDELMGLSATMELTELQRLLGGERSLSGVFLAVDPLREAELYRTLKRAPGVAGVALTAAAIESFRQTLAETLRLMVTFNVLFAGVIAFGVVYNVARITLSELQRDLASLRILGFTRREISSILLGELGVVTLVAMPIGAAMGAGLALLTLLLNDNELIRLPLVIEPSTFAWAIATVLVASALSAALVRRRLDSLDLVAVLKTRD